MGRNKKEIVKGFKATNKDLKCRDFQYKLGKEYKEDKAELCNSGFHFCENPLDILNYYNVCESRFFEIEAKDISDEKREDDTKRVSKKIKLTTELNLSGLIKASFKYIKEQCEIKDDKNVIENNDRNSQVATSGDDSQVATSGDDSKVATSGYNSKVATSGNYSQVATSGYNSQVATSGNYSQVAINGEHSVGMCAGYNCSIKGKKGNWITLVEWEYSNEVNKYIPICVRSIQIDGQIIKEDTYYKLENGEFIEC